MVVVVQVARFTEHVPAMLAEPGYCLVETRGVWYRDDELAVGPQKPVDYAQLPDRVRQMFEDPPKRHDVEPLRRELSVTQGAVLNVQPQFGPRMGDGAGRSEEHTSELQSLAYLVCRLLLEKKKKETES